MALAMTIEGLKAVINGKPLISTRMLMMGATYFTGKTYQTDRAGLFAALNDLQRIRFERLPENTVIAA